MIYIGSDHRGYELKEKVKNWLTDFGYEYEDLGPSEYNKDDDYPDFAKLVAEAVTLRQAQVGDGVGDPESTNKEEKILGILICGSGIGVAIVANKIKGIRAGTASTPDQVKASVSDEDLNILALSADYVSEEINKEIIKTYLESEFSGEERHIRRVNKIKELENK